MKHFFVCAIGPVQEFIATARRSRDLWYGSWMLSELSKAAARQIGKLSPPGELIFPYPSKPGALEPGSDFNVPNKIVALIDGDPKTVAEGENGLHKAVKNRLGDLWTDACTHVKGKIDEPLAQEQIDDLLEFYWVSVPYTDSYKNARDAAERLLAARKATRNFDQATGKSTPKSSLDGARESVIPMGEYSERNDTEDVKTRKTENLYERYHARRGEQLSGVDLLKRLGQPDKSPKFPSTSDMAAFPFLAQIDQKKGAGQSAELIAEIRKLMPQDFEEIDGTQEGLVFESRFTEWAETQPSANELRKKFTTVLKKYAGDTPPSPYYALLTADGDHMGLVIDAQTDPQTHCALSLAMSKFASEAPGIVTKYDGALIYSGGDDVLAYLPLHTVLACAAELESAFRNFLPKKDFQAQKNGITIFPTLSIGIVIAHHLEPLSGVLELAREAEGEAKKVDPVEKNGLAITLSKRGGADRTIAGKFAELAPRLEKLIQFAETKVISAGAAYELQSLHRDLSTTTVASNGLAKEALRIIARKRESGRAEGIKPEVKGAFEGWIAPRAVPLNELALEMIIAKEFALEEKEAL